MFNIEQLCALNQPKVITQVVSGRFVFLGIRPFVKHRCSSAGENMTHSRVRTAGRLLLLLLSAYPVYSQETKVAKGTAAYFKGTPINMEDVRKAAAPDLELADIQHLQAEANYTRAKHTALEKALAAMIENKVLDAEASSRGITREALLEKELAGKAKEPTMADLAAHLPPTGLPSEVSREKLFERYKQYLKTENYNRAKNEYVTQLRKKYGVTVALKPLRSTVETAGSPSVGPEGAQVTLVEFSSFQCSGCGSFAATVQDVLKKYGKQVRLVYRHFTQERTGLAEQAAEASLCAADQNRFWEMHDLLFKSGHFEPPALMMHAAKLDLDLTGFNACMSSRRHADTVKKDLYAAAGLGVTSAPTLFINGRLLAGVRSADAIGKIIEEELHGSSGAAGPIANNARVFNPTRTTKTTGSPRGEK
jgi:protein-disulfide isomerase